MISLQFRGKKCVYKGHNIEKVEKKALKLNYRKEGKQWQASQQKKINGKISQQKKSWKNKSVEKIMAICKELNLQVKTDLPLEQNTYLSAWHKGTTHI